MDFDDTPEEAAFRAEARAWLEAHAVPRGHPDDWSDGHLSGAVDEATHVANCKKWQRALYDGGWAGIAWPERFGGRGGTAMQQTIFNQEQADFGVTNGVFAVAHGMVGPTLMRHGTTEQQERFLTAMLRGDEVWCQLFSEPGAGSDLAGLSTKAVRDGDEWVVTGQKVWTSNAQHCEWGILIARTDLDVPKHKGLTYFLVDMASPGFDIRPLRQINGQSHFSEVFLDEVRIPAGQVLGAPGEGWRVAITTLSNERAAISGSRKGDEVEELLTLARRRGATADPVMRQRLAEVWSRNQLLRFLRYRLQTAISQGRQPGPEASVMKLFYAEHVKRLADTALVVEGATGSLWGDADDHGFWQGRFLLSASLSIGGGTNEIQRNVIAERVLGLPGEARVDRDVPYRELLGAKR